MFLEKTRPISNGEAKPSNRDGHEKGNGSPELLEILATKNEERNKAISSITEMINMIKVITKSRKLASF
jgi:hypothetical protein